MIKLIPDARMAVISLSSENCPNAMRAAINTAMGTAKAVIPMGGRDGARMIPGRRGAKRTADGDTVEGAGAAGAGEDDDQWGEKWISRHTKGAQNGAKARKLGDLSSKPYTWAHPQHNEEYRSQCETNPWFLARPWRDQDVIQHFDRVQPVLASSKEGGLLCVLM